LKSEHGLHLVLYTGHTPARSPELAEVNTQVYEDLKRNRMVESQERAVASLVSSYEVVLAQPLQPAPK
jgi:hypothetical protein